MSADTLADLLTRNKYTLDGLPNEVRNATEWRLGVGPAPGLPRQAEARVHGQLWLLINGRWSQPHETPAGRLHPLAAAADALVADGIAVEVGILPTIAIHDDDDEIPCDLDELEPCDCGDYNLWNEDDVPPGHFDGGW